MALDTAEIGHRLESVGTYAAQEKWQRRAWIAFLSVGSLFVWFLFRADFWLWQYIILGIWYAGLMWFGLRWPAFRRLFLVVLAVAAPGVALYDLGYTAKTSALLYWIFQSTSMFYWMSLAIALSAVGYYRYLYAGIRPVVTGAIVLPGWPWSWAMQAWPFVGSRPMLVIPAGDISR